MNDHKIREILKLELIGSKHERKYWMGIQKLIVHGKIIKALKKNSFGTTTPFEGQDRRSTMNENHSDKYVGIMAFDPASIFKRSKRIKAHRRPKYPHTNMDLDHDLKSGLWAI